MRFQLFHRSRKARHATPARPPACTVAIPVAQVRAAVRIPALGPGFMAQRPYERVLLAPAPSPRLHIGDRVAIARYGAFPAHNGRRGSIAQISGDHRLALVELYDGGTVYCKLPEPGDPGELDLLDAAPTAEFPALPGDTLAMDAVRDELPLMGGVAR